MPQPDMVDDLTVDEWSNTLDDLDAWKTEALTLRKVIQRIAVLPFYREQIKPHLSFSDRFIIEEVVFEVHND